MCVCVYVCVCYKVRNVKKNCNAEIRSRFKVICLFKKKIERR